MRFMDVVYLRHTQRFLDADAVVRAYDGPDHVQHLVARHERARGAVLLGHVVFEDVEHDHGVLVGIHVILSTHR